MISTTISIRIVARISSTNHMLIPGGLRRGFRRRSQHQQPGRDRPPNRPWGRVGVRGWSLTPRLLSAQVMRAAKDAAPRVRAARSDWPQLKRAAVQRRYDRECDGPSRLYGKARGQTARLAWCGERLQHLFSQGCIAENFVDYINFWKHNGYWFFDSPEIIIDIARENEIDLGGTVLFFYEVHDLQFDSGEWRHFEPERSFGTNVSVPEAKARAIGRAGAAGRVIASRVPAATLDVRRTPNYN